MKKIVNRRKTILDIEPLESVYPTTRTDYPHVKLSRSPRVLLGRIYDAEVSNSNRNYMIVDNFIIYGVMLFMAWNTPGNRNVQS